jgi:hypothetical protein
MKVIKMGDIGIDKWFEMMAEHKKRGHNIIQYPIPLKRDKR